jgi:hypothetical protein
VPQKKNAMNIIYRMTENNCYLESDAYTSYGIAAYTGEDTVIDAVYNISTNRHAVAELVALCNRLELSAVHLRDIVSDFLENNA